MSEESATVLDPQQSLDVVEEGSTSSSPNITAVSEDLLIPTFHQVPWSSLVARVDSGSQGIFEFQSLLQDRKENDERQLMHYMKMSKANLFQYEIETSTSERMLGFFKNYHLFIHKALIHQHKEFIELVLKDLETLKVDRAAVINKHKVSIQSCLRDISLAQDGLDKAKKHYLKTKSDFQRSSERLVQAEKAVEESIRISEERKRDVSTKETNKSWSRMFSAFESTPEQERDKQQKKVDKRRDELAVAADNIVERRQLLLNMLSRYDEEIQEATLSFQQLETERMQKMQRFMKTFCDLEKQVLNSKLQQLQIYEEAVSLQQPEEDIALFITQSRQTELTHKFGSALALLEEFNALKMEDDMNFEEVQSVDNNISPVGDSIETDVRPSVSDKIGGDMKTQMSGEVVDDSPNRSMNENTAVSPLESVSPSNEKDVQEEIDPVSSTVRDTLDFVPDPNLEKLNNCLHVIFRSNHKQTNQVGKEESDNNSPIVTQESESVDVPVYGLEEWREMLNTKSLRSRFMQELDHKRGKHATLDHAQFETLANALVSFLDVCEGSDDMMVAVSAMRVANMANTFHRIVENSKESEDKIYLHSDPRFLDHSIWKKQGFWELALKESVFSQMQNHLTIMRWDEMEMDELREVVQGIHNIIFGQLGTLSFAMMQQGLSQNEVLENIIRMSRKFELSEDQEFELVVNITGRRVKEYVPPPILAVPNMPPSGTPGEPRTVSSEAKVFAVPTGQTQKKPSVFSRARKSMADASKPTVSNPQGSTTATITAQTVTATVVSSKNPESVSQPHTHHVSTTEPKKSKLSFLASMGRSTNTANTVSQTPAVATPGKAVAVSVVKSPAVHVAKGSTQNHQHPARNDLDDDFFAVL